MEQFPNSTPIPTPTALPRALRREPAYDEEIEFSMGKLIKQASRIDFEPNFTQSHSPKGSKSRELKPKKSLNNFRIEELQGFKDLGFDFDNELGPKVIHMTPSSPSNKMNNVHEKNTTRKPYLSEGRKGNSDAQVLRWGDEISTDEIKAQIKSWARAVAIIVRQEC